MMKLIQVASELGINRNTVRDRLDHYGLRRTRQTTRRAADLGRQSRPIACNGHGARSAHRGERLLHHRSGSDLGAELGDIPGGLPRSVGRLVLPQTELVPPGFLADREPGCPVSMNLARVSLRVSVMLGASGR